MRKCILFTMIGLSLTSLGLGQNINALSDYNNRLYKFDSGRFSQIYYQKVKDLILGNQYIAYVDNKGDVMINFKDQEIMIAQTYNEMLPSDNLLLVRTANVLRVFDQTRSHILTSSAKYFAMNDSIVLWQDQIGGYLKYYYKGEVNEVTMVVGDYIINKDHVGANTFVYTDNVGTMHLFWHGKYYEILSSTVAVHCIAGQDIVAFNDPNTRTFAIFDQGEFFDVEDQHTDIMQVGNGFVYYKDASGTHKVYHHGKVQELSFAEITNVNVKDSVVIFNDVGINKIWYNNEVYQIFNAPLTNYQVDGGIVAYRNNVGGVDAFVRGEEIQIEGSLVQHFKLHGNTILLQYSPSSYGVWWNGKVYRF